MLFYVRMDVSIPHDVDSQPSTSCVWMRQRAHSSCQRDGTWRHLWRIVGEYANISIFDVESPDKLHEILMSLPLFPFMQIKVTQLCRHPSAIASESD